MTASTTRRRQSSTHYLHHRYSHSYSYRHLATPVLLLLVVLQEYNAGFVGASSSCDENDRKNHRLRLYMVRHGESAANQLGLYAGQDDVPLTEEGILQAKLLGSSMSTRWPMFWRLYSSDLIRARNTAAFILQHNHHPPPLQESAQQEVMERLILDKRLRERSYGARQGMSRQLTEEQALVIWKSHNLEPPIFETNEDLWQRGSEWLFQVWNDLKTHLHTIHTSNTAHTNKHEDDQDGQSCDEENDEVVYHVLVVTHAGIIREFLKHLFSMEELRALGAEWDRQGALIIPNTSVTTVEFELIDDHQENSNFLHTAALLEVANASHLEQFQVHSD